MCVHVHASVRAHTRACMFVCVCVCACAYVCMCVRTYSGEKANREMKPEKGACAFLWKSKRCAYCVLCTPTIYAEHDGFTLMRRVVFTHDSVTCHGVYIPNDVHTVCCAHTICVRRDLFTHICEMTHSRHTMCVLLSGIRIILSANRIYAHRVTPYAHCNVRTASHDVRTLFWESHNTLWKLDLRTSCD